VWPPVFVFLKRKGFPKVSFKTGKILEKFPFLGETLLQSIFVGRKLKITRHHPFD